MYKQKIRKQFVFVLCLLITVITFLVACTNNPDHTSEFLTSTKSSSTTKSNIPTTTMPTNAKPAITREIKPIFLPPDMSGRMTDMLKVVPDNPKISQDQVWFIDFAAWDATLGLNTNDYRNTSGIPDITSEKTYVTDLLLSSLDIDDRIRPRWYPWLGQPPFISGMGLGSNDNDYTHGLITANPVCTKFIGYGPLDIEQSILSSSIYQNSPGYYEIIKGNFNTSVISHTMDQYIDDNLSPQKSISNGIDIYSWESEIANYDRKMIPPIFDGSGRGHTLAVQPDFILGSQEPMRVDEMIDASQGRMPSLADDPLYQELATKLENMGNMSAVISVDKILRQDLWPGKSSFFEKAASYAPLMGLYTAFAAGLSVDDKGMFVSLVLLYESPDLAEHDIEVLKERLAAGTNSMNSPWAKEVDDSEIWADGNALCAKLYGNVTSYWDCLVHQEPLLVREN
jgi:hypothetical protein